MAQRLELKLPVKPIVTTARDHLADAESPLLEELCARGISGLSVEDYVKGEHWPVKGRLDVESILNMYWEAMDCRQECKNEDAWTIVVRDVLKT